MVAVVVVVQVQVTAVTDTNLPETCVFYLECPVTQVPLKSLRQGSVYPLLVPLHLRARVKVLCPKHRKSIWIM